MMSRVILGELRVVVTSFFCGALITVVYDVLRIFRRGIYHSNFWIGVEDLIFWIWTALWTFGVLYRENDGNLRLYTMLSMGAGMILYHMSISEPLVAFLGRVLRWIVVFFIKPFSLVKFYMIFWGKKLKKYLSGIIMKTKSRKKG